MNASIQVDPRRPWLRAEQYRELSFKRSTTPGASYSSLQRVAKIKTASPGPKQFKHAQALSKNASKRLFRKSKKARLKSRGLSDSSALHVSEARSIRAKVRAALLQDADEQARVLEQRKAKNKAKRLRRARGLS